MKGAFSPAEEPASPVTLIAGCGDVGGRLARRLISAGHTVFGLRRNCDLLPDGVIPVPGDLSDSEHLSQWPESIDYVVYCAAAGRGEDSYRETYIKGLENVINHLLKMAEPPKRIFFTSSTAVYHQNDGEWVDELSPTHPTGFNGQVMLEAEALLMSSGLSATVVRFGGIYGPGRNYMVNKVKAGEVFAQTPLVYGNRIHSEDCAGMLAWLVKLDRAGEGVHPLYLGVDSNPAPLSEVTRWLAQQLDVKSVKKNRVSGRGSKRCRNDRILESGYRFQYPDYRSGYSEILGAVLTNVGISKK